jgi:PAS domain S-box-containing protein
MPDPVRLVSNEGLRESEERYRVSFVQAPTPLLMLDRDGRIIEASERCLDLLGCAREEAIGADARDLLRLEPSDQHEEGWEQIIAEGTVRDAERQLLRRDGKVLDVLVSSRAERDAAGSPVRVIVAIIDITARKRAEEAQRESDMRFRLLVEGVADHALYMLDRSGYVTNWNSGARRIKGYAPAEIIGEHFSRFYTGEDRKALLPERALATAVKDGRYEEEGWRVRKDGTRFWASVVIQPIRNEEGALIGFAKVTRDITERHEAQQALDAAREQLAQAQKMEAIGQLTGGIAHDFNNVLQAMVGNLEMIRRRVGDERSDLARLAGNALIAAEKASGLTSQLLAFARRQRLDPKPFDPVQVVQGMRGLLARTVGERIALRVEVPGAGVGTCLADVNQLESALLNLVINARDAIEEATGTVTLSLRTARVDAVSADAEYVRIAVRDDGPGMPEEVRRRAFEPFFTTKGNKGTGLGLAQIDGFVHQSGGAVQIDSTVGVGTEVAILLPRTDEPVQRAAAPPTSGADPELGRGETVLIVEDDALVRAALAETLRDLRYRIIEAADADAALAMLDGGVGVDAIFSDVMLPGSMDGLEFAIAARTRLPGIPVILTTGHAGALAGRPLPPGVIFLRKPHSRNRIAAAVRSSLAETQTAIGTQR